MSTRIVRDGIEALELDHLIVLGSGYVGLEMAQAYRRFGSRVTVIERGPQIMSREDPDVSRELQRILGAEGIQFVCAAEPLNVRGRSGEEVSVTVRTASGERTIGGTDILVAAGRARSASAVHGDRNYLPLILWRTRRRPGDRLHLPASRGDRAGC